jgi:hypothetical protein
MAVHANHLVVEQFAGQRVASGEERTEGAVDVERLPLFDWPKLAGEAHIRPDFDIKGMDGCPCLVTLAARSVELRIDIDLPGLAVSRWEDRASPMTMNAEKCNIGNLHESLVLMLFSGLIEGTPGAMVW